MKITVLGTGVVGRAHAARLAELGHDVVIGTRDVDHVQDAQDGTDFATWRSAHPGPSVAELADAIDGAELVVNALSGAVAVDVLGGLADPIGERVVLDITNPLDFSTGEFRLLVANTDSLGEQIQRAAPRARVVKSLCTVNAAVQVDPAVLGEPTDMFLAGDDAAAKATVTDILHSYGWPTPIDLGGIVGARALEMMLPMWLGLYQTLGTTLLNYRVVHRPE